MADKPYTDADVERVARSLFDADQRRLVAKHAHLPGVTPGRWSDMLADTRRLYEDRSRAVLDDLADAGRLPAEHHRPLLALTADEVEAIRRALMQRPINAPHVSSALDKLAEARP